MDEAEYRKQVEEQLKQAAERKTSYRDFLDKTKSTRERITAFSTAPRVREKDDIAETLLIIRNRDEDFQVRIAALNGIRNEIGESEEVIDLMLATLQDVNEHPELRQAALAGLQQGDFTGRVFPAKRADYLAALRSIVEDKNTKLRQQAIEILAREKDEYVQRRLIDGLKKTSKALVPPAKAIQLLGYDIHETHYSLLRQIVNDPPSKAAKKEAVLLLGAYAAAKPLLTKILKDKTESPEVRAISAAALQSLDPVAFEKEAKRIALDNDEDDKLRATSITALTHFANKETLSKDEKFNKKVEQLKSKSTSIPLKQATKLYLSKK
jgi:hypothetical protein